jgi:hypothetical protein
MSFFNEFMVTMYLYLLMTLTDFMGPNPLRDDIGWALLLTVVSTVAVNLIKAMCVDLKWVAEVLRTKWCTKKGK